MSRPLRAIQQGQLAKALTGPAAAAAALEAAKAAGFEAIELLGFMIRRTPLMVRALMAAGRMPIGGAGKFDWPGLVAGSGLRVIGIHEDLGTIEQDPGFVVDECRSYGAENVAIPGVYRFDFRSHAALTGLATRLNRAGERLAQDGLRLLWHNHNVELTRVGSQTAFDVLLENTDPALVGFEFDAYWPTAAGADPVALLRKLGRRVELIHLTDRGARLVKAPLTPLVKADSVELGQGNMDLDALIDQAKSVGVAAVILETHRNWIDRDPVKSLRLSAEHLNARLPDQAPHTNS
jgi:sugar phosphate isomerase/epimerase